MNVEYIIKSENEIDGKYTGYWNNDIGWCEYPDEATIFNHSEINTFRLPIGNNPTWAILSEEQKCIENFDKGDFMLRLVPHVGKEVVLTYCCPTCDLPVARNISLTRELLADLIGHNDSKELLRTCGCDAERISLYRVRVSDITQVEL